MPRPEMTALGLLAAHNLIQNRVLRDEGYVTGNLVVTAGLIALGRHADLDWREMGLGPGDLRRGLGISVPIATVALVLAVTAARIPASRARIRDERVAATSFAEAARTAMIRFPLGTALFEEVAFRGVLAPLFAKNRTPICGEVASAAAFALWHLIPTHYALVVNGPSDNRRARLIGTVAGAGAAGMAGYFLSRLRDKTGSLLASWLIHGSVNSSSYMAVVLSRGGGRSLVDLVLDNRD